MRKLVNICCILILLLISQPVFAQEQAYIIVLGISQDGGYPHMGCTKECCSKAWEDPSLRRNAVSLALVDPLSQQWYLFEATPDIREQLHLFRELTGSDYDYLPEAVFVSHAHTGHYTGLMQFGREVMNTDGITVGSELALSERVSVKTFAVPHRDEYSETAGYIIKAGGSSYLFIPDVDKWDKLDRDIIEMVNLSDLAFLDGTFHSADELPGRNMDEIPHPLITETMDLFSNEDKETIKKIHFIHLNHSNPVLFDPGTRSVIRDRGFEITEPGKIY